MAHLGNALLISYAALQVQLLEVRFVFRRGLGYTLAVLIVAVGYVLVFFAMLQLLIVANWGFALAVLGIALIVTMASPQLRCGVQSLVDRVLFRRRSDAQGMLQELSEAVASELDLDVLAHRVLECASTTLNIEWACLFLETKSGDFQVEAMYRSTRHQSEEEPRADVLRIPAGHMLLDCLSRQRAAMTCEELLRLSGQGPNRAGGEDLLARLGVELFVPIHLRGELVGILAFGGREGGRPYGPEERIALITLANQAAVAIANARLMAAERDQRQFAETVLRESAAGLMVVDAQGGITMANPAAEAIIGWPIAEITSRSVVDILGGGGEEDQRRLMEALSAGETRAQLELTVPRPDGPRHVLVSIASLGDGRQLLSLTDVTRLKELDRLKSEFVANVSHELRTPLASIKAYAELLLDELESGNRELQREFLEVIDRQTDHLATLISDLLDLARLESGRHTLDKRPLDLREVVDEVKQMLEIQAKIRDVHLEVDVPEDLPPILADRDLITSMVKNLIGNAIKFSHEGGKVQVTARKVEDALEFCVSDQGVGIPPDAIPHLFEKFYRPRPTVERAIRGTGLGLALTKEAVEAHGGTIDVESELGVGSQFRVRIPYTQEEGTRQ
jgi:PAS domain S-box-containing protein